MCGITGLYHTDGQPADAHTVQRMIDLLAHRGPDGDRVWTQGSVGFGHRRLAILDVSTAADQPMHYDDCTLTFNGEFYNFKGVRQHLEALGHTFHTTGDTEVLLHAYREWGIDCVTRFNGMFAFALWDNREQLLWLVRDRLGIKPLFYAVTDGHVAFGSEIKSILPTLPGRDLDHDALGIYLSANYIPAPRTIFKAVRQLEPGQVMRVNSDGDVQINTYWHLHYDERPLDEHTAQRELETLLDDAVSARLVSDVPLGAFLSGGVDSSTIAYWMRQHRDNDIKTFTVGFNESAFDESSYAAQVATGLNLQRYSLTLTDAHATPDLLRKLVWHAEEPTADSSMLSVYYLSQLARQHVAVALSGDGADELLAGYETHQAFYAARVYHALPGLLRDGVISPLVNRLPVQDGKVTLETKLKRFVYGASHTPEDAHALWRVIFNAEERRALLLNPNTADIVDEFRRHFQQTDAQRPLNRLLYTDTRLYLPSDMLVKVDRMSMAHGLEARVPFLDHRLVELCARIPAEYKLHRLRQKKYLLRQAMRGKLPDAILDRKKAGFNLPNALWLRGDLREFAGDMLAPGRMQAMGLFNADEVSRVWDDHQQKRADNSHKLWGLLTFSLWWQQFIEQPLPIRSGSQ
ncbi:MAG: asparagine synthase (glutamine-hydrolyzing) [Chloroflexota bacterium]